jgi:hypothetical protein
MAKAKTRFTCLCGRDIGGRANIERHKQSCEKLRSTKTVERTVRHYNPYQPGRSLDIAREVARLDAMVFGEWEGLPLAVLYACIDRQVYELQETMANPNGWSKGQLRSEDELRKIAEEDIRVRYRRGICAFCEGPAVRCAERHAEGRSCA